MASVRAPGAWSRIITIAVIFGAGIVLGLWLNRSPGPVGLPPSSQPATKPPVKHEGPKQAPHDPAESVVMDVYERLSPAVVNIVTRRQPLTYWMQVIPQTGQGSGIVIDANGHILTNNHVVANADYVEVTFAGGRRVQAKLVGRDPISDLAVIKVEPFPEMQVAPLGTSENLKVGQRVIAIGNPFGFQNTVTSGFISALHRDIAVGDQALMGMIQTDAAINPGNSGGPLISSSGDVIGVNTAIYSPAGAFTGIGFATPIDRAKKVAKQILTLGTVIYPWAGIRSWMDIDQELAVRMNLPPVRGVLIFELFPGGPAQHAGLHGGTSVAYYQRRPILLGGDVILAVDGTATPTFDDFQNIIRQRNVGDTVNITFQRGKDQLTAPMTLQADPRTRA